jgi:hypothetical protein
VLENDGKVKGEFNLQANSYFAGVNPNGPMKKDALSEEDLDSFTSLQDGQKLRGSNFTPPVPKINLSS